MLGIHDGVDVDMGEGLLDIQGPLDIPQDMLYNRGAPPASGSFLSAEQENKLEKVDVQIMYELNEACDMESQTSKHRRRLLDNGDSPRSGKSSRSQEETSIGMHVTGPMAGCGENSTTFRSTAQRVRPKHICKECGKTFKRAHNLKIHGRLHSGDKPYRCPFGDCEKEFRWKSSIVSHLNWHRTKRGDVLPTSFANMHSLILKKKKGGGNNQKSRDKQEAVGAQVGQVGLGVPEQKVDEGRVEYGGDVGQKYETGGEMSEMGHIGGTSSYPSGLTEVGIQYEENMVEKEEKDDATIVTPSTTSYQASPVAMEMGELDCLPSLDGREWETRSEGCRSGFNAVLLPSLSCCRIENDGDGFGSFLEDN